MRQILTLSVIALLAGGCVIGPDDFGIIEFGESPSYASFDKAETYDGEDALDVDVELKVGRLAINAGEEGKVYDLDAYFNENAFEPRVDFNRSGEGGRLRIELSSLGKGTRSVGKNRLNVRLNPNVGIDLSARTGVGETEIDLTGLKVRSLRFEAGVAETTIMMDSANTVECGSVDLKSGVGSMELVGLGNLGFRNLEFKGGVGAATLDFSGDWNRVGEVEIEVGIGGVQIRLPRHIGAEIRTSSSFLSGFDVRGFTKRGKVYYSDNIDRVDKVVRFRIRAGIGGVEVGWL